jgi:hypothetical protein
VTGRLLGLAPWAPKAKTLDLLAEIDGVLSEYAAFLPLTLRQVFYRLIGRYGYPKEERAYKGLSEVLNRARRAGRIPWDAIRDDGITWHRPEIASEDVDAHVAAMLSDFPRLGFDRQEGQPTRLILGVEAAGMAAQLADIAVPLGVPVFGSGGFDSATFKHQFAQELAQTPGRLEILSVGDYDNSGESLFDNLRDDILAMLRDLGCRPAVSFTRVAVTPAQIAAYDLPTAPAKATDRRRLDITATTQAEALAPNVLHGLVRAAIESRQDAEVRQVVLRREIAVTAELNGRMRWLRGFVDLPDEEEEE